ncbi:ATP-binding cassette domain-containing protein [Candidatus Pacearchaeota archaeon]|nr:ATP-binding cassette domain-containing protein [Candidatus Pacearchaeota archaeon]
MRLLLKEVSLQLNDTKILNGLNLQLDDDEILGLVGPNGCGKTTTLLTILGIYKHTSGHVDFDGACIDKLKTCERIDSGIVLVPQSLHQFWISCHQKVCGFNPGITVLENVCEVMESERRALKLLEIFGLASIKQKMPTQLSWGQQQRLAILRMCAFKPRVLLLDEPFGATDWQSEKKLKEFIRQYLKENHISAIYAASKPMETKGFCDRVILIEEGKIKSLRKQGES